MYYILYIIYYILYIIYKHIKLYTKYTKYVNKIQRLGVLVRPGNRIRFVRACVRAKLRVAARRCCFRGGVSKTPTVLRPGLVSCPSPIAAVHLPNSLVKHFLNWLEHVRKCKEALRHCYIVLIRVK